MFLPLHGSVVVDGVRAAFRIVLATASSLATLNLNPESQLQAEVLNPKPYQPEKS